ncbi:rhomboid family intramembrane serine protease [Alteromonas sp. a30]|uniref:rhomboid family intramembrane serine protease n=1 Tax=Alteromonas sp. a30 TaxID=2730917 RepID=UPI002281E74B|nr:rhomboid family intramembrane serine protease [Alteromonas sp. a30]MCY7294487.1 rhomboid family intramembrane serine protease [Alteromonas sp. a30]
MKSSTPSSLQISVALFVLLTVLEVINIFTGRMLNQFSILPRSLEHLTGIFFSPFLHGSFWHFTSNIFPVCLFTYLVLQWGKTRYLMVSAFIIIVTGLLVWLLGRPAFHLGASGLIYGYFGFLVLAGFLSKKPRLLFISLFVGLLYGGLIFGILPLQNFVSWESHLFGLISGLIAAYLWPTPQSQ